MYGKIFDSIYDGTLYGKWEALVTFQQFIVLSDADGTVDMTPMAISARTGIPREIIDKGIEVLEAPDPYTRTPGSDGVRIERLDEHRPWGWTIVNHEKYKRLQDSDTVREQTRERVRKHRERKKKVKDVTDGNGAKRHTDTDTDTDKDLKIKVKTEDPFDRWWRVYPKKRKKKTARAIWKKKRLDAKVSELIIDVSTRISHDERWLNGYVPDPTTYLNQERWDDELTDDSGKKLTYTERMALAAEKMK